jgi:hypothetical protein
MPKPSLAARRAELARAERQKRLNPADPKLAHSVIDLRRNYTAEKLAEYVAKIVADAPPLSAVQRDRISALLRGGAA